MTRREHLLTIAMEECNEVAQRLSKALRFGLDEVQPGQGLNNAMRVEEEFADLVAVLRMLHMGFPSPHEMAAKQEKVERFLAYSAECGTLTPEASS
jgi:hypothetical protein